MRKIYLSIMALGLAFQAGAQATTPFTCSNGVDYQIASNVLIKYTVTPTAGYSTIATITPSGTTNTGASVISNGLINAIGYDVNSNMIWGVLSVGGGSTVQLVEIDANGKASYFTIKNPPASWSYSLAGSSYVNYNVGDVNNGYLYFASVNASGAYYYVVDINPKRSTYLQLVNPANLTQASNTAISLSTSYGTIADWSYTKNNTLVSVSVSNGTFYLVTYNPATGGIVGTPVQIKGAAVNASPAETGFGATFYDAAGNLYAFGNKTGYLYQVITSTGNTTLLNQTQANNSNDGANCPNASLLAPPSSSLPITLQSFTVNANGNTASVQWATAVESNNKGFYVERSTDGQNWQDLTFVASKATNGNSATPLNYQYTDQFPQQGYNYYRLKQVDLDGTATFSDVQSVVFNNIGVRIYPNPTNGVLHVVLSTPATYQLVNAGGAVALKGSLQSGNNLLNVTGLSSGIYFMQIISDKNVKNTYEIEIK